MSELPSPVSVDDLRIVGPVDVSLRQFTMDERGIAFMHATTAFHFAKRERPPGLDRVLRARIQDAWRDGIRDAETMALRALEREGYAVAWVTRGELAIIEFVEPKETRP